MKKKLIVLALTMFLFSFIGIVNAHGSSPHDRDEHHHESHYSHNNHDKQWQDDHDKQWRDHDREWRDHDREWKEHDGDRDWRERHAHEWHDWYEWHHDNEDEGFDDFIFGAIIGILLGEAK